MYIKHIHIYIYIANMYIYIYIYIHTYNCSFIFCLGYATQPKIFTESRLGEVGIKAHAIDAIHTHQRASNLSNQPRTHHAIAALLLLAQPRQVVQVAVRRRRRRNGARPMIQLHKRNHSMVVEMSRFEVMMLKT